MDKCREAFEQLPEIKNSLGENIVFVGNKYTTANEGFYDLVNWLNGGWYTWQSRQAELDQAYADIETFAQAHQRECDIKVQIANELKEKDKRIETLITTWRDQAKELCNVDDKHVREALLSCADELKALRGEHE